MKTKLILICLMLFLSLTFVSAIQPTQQTNKIFLSPFYRSSMTANTNNTYNLSITPTDGISKVYSAVITLQAYLTPTVTFNLWVNNQRCNNPSYTVSTTFAGAGQGTITFDCSNVITKAGNYNVIIQSSSANVGASTSWLDISYTNDPQGNVLVHGTEYLAGQPGKLWLQLINANGTALTNAVCYVDIYTPDNTEYLEHATMTNMVHDGIYYYDLLTPTEHGVYPAIATCYYDAGQTFNFAQMYNIVNGTYQSGAITDTWTADGNYLNLVETPSPTSPRVLKIDFNFTTPRVCTNISELLLNGITIYWTGRWNSNLANDVLTFQIFNYTSSSWVSLGNTVTGSGTGQKSVSNGMSFTNITKAGFVNGSGSNLRVRVIDANLADTSSSGFDTDYLTVSCDQLANPQWQQVKGSSEMHITSDVNYILNPTSTYTINNTQDIQLFNGTNNNFSYYTGIFRNDFIIESADATVTSNLIEYQGLHSIPCNSIIGFYKYNSTGYYGYNYTLQRQTAEDHCSVNFNLDLSPGEISQFVVLARNTWESEVRSINTGVNSVYPLLSAGCDLWAITQNETPYPYIIPKNQTNENRSYFYRACANWNDDFYWFNQTYYTGLSDKAKIVDQQTYLQYEADYYSSKFAEAKLTEITHLLLNDLITTGIYSDQILKDMLNRSNMYGNRFWANVSSMQINKVLILNVNSSTWNYYNRTLTSSDFNITASVNSTEIANSVWSSNATISSGLLDQIADKIWNWISRYTHGEILT